MSRRITDLFGHPMPSQELFRKDGRRRKIGYAARPGSGPRRQRCRTCKSCMAVLSKGVRSHKCEVMAKIWSDDPATDIKPNAPACREWATRPFNRSAAAIAA